jgi:hypothetical protein
MAHQDTLAELKQKFASNDEWQEFLSFIDSQKARGGSQELWLQWEIYLLKCQANKVRWKSQDSRFSTSTTPQNLTQFQ